MNELISDNNIDNIAFLHANHCGCFISGDATQLLKWQVRIVYGFDWSSPLVKKKWQDALYLWCLLSYHRPQKVTGQQFFETTDALKSFSKCICPLDSSVSLSFLSTHWDSHISSFNGAQHWPFSSPPAPPHKPATLYSPTVL